MNGAKDGLDQGLLIGGYARLAEIWGVDHTTVGKRLNGQLGIKIEELARALDALGVRVIPPQEDVVVVPRDRYEAERTLLRHLMLAENNGEGK